MSGKEPDGSPNECRQTLHYDYHKYYNTRCVECFNNILEEENVGFICNEKGFICKFHILNHLDLKKTTLNHSSQNFGTYSYTYKCNRPFCNIKKANNYFKTKNDITKENLEAYIKFLNLNLNCNEDNTEEQLFDKLQEIGKIQGYKIERSETGKLNCCLLGKK